MSWPEIADPAEPDDTSGDRFDAFLGRGSGPTNWRAVPAERAVEQWRLLHRWVCWFRDRFGYDYRVVPPCWYLHPAQVELLSALRDHWLSAYDPLNSPTAASEWHRVLAQLEPRLREWAARTGCTTREHRPDPTASVIDDAARWETHLREDTVHRVTTSAQQR
jgi:hypothetical protein